MCFCSNKNDPRVNPILPFFGQNIQIYKEQLLLFHRFLFKSYNYIILTFKKKKKVSLPHPPKPPYPTYFSPLFIPCCNNPLILIRIIHTFPPLSINTPFLFFIYTNPKNTSKLKKYVKQRDNFIRLLKILNITIFIVFFSLSFILNLRAFTVFHSDEDSNISPIMCFFQCSLCFLFKLN